MYSVVYQHKRIHCIMPFFEYEAIIGNYFLMYFFTSFKYVGKRRWPNVTIGREWPQILQHLSSVSKTEQNAKENFRTASLPQTVHLLTGPGGSTFGCK